MSLPSYLASIKSSGIYRFVWDKSEIPPAQAQIMRMLIGYSDKGPFNTPVYVDKSTDFINIFGNISKRAERRGIYFNRLALQALGAGPILALNIKPFTTETVSCLQFDGENIKGMNSVSTSQVSVKSIYDTNRFWYLNADSLPKKVVSVYNPESAKYITIVSTDVKDSSCSVFIRKTKPTSYGLTIRQWYANDTSLEMPMYLESIQDNMLNEYFVDVYVFKGKFTKELCSGNGPLAKYFELDGDGKPVLKQTVTNVFGEEVDALDVMASDANSNFVASYTGCTIPYFKDAMGGYISIDVLFNKDNSTHKMMMKLDEATLEVTEDVDKLIKPEYLVDPESTITVSTYYKRVGDGSDTPYSYEKFGDGDSSHETTADSHVVAELPEATEDSEEYVRLDEKVTFTGVAYKWNSSAYEKIVDGEDVIKKSDYDAAKYVYGSLPSTQVGGAVIILMSNFLYPTYMEGYTYDTIKKNESGKSLQDKILGVLSTEVGLRQALTNNVDVQYRYLVDTFEGYVEDSMGCKSKLTSIAKEKFNALAIVNFPALPEFVDSGNFTSSVTGKFDISLIPSKFTLPSDTDGASWAAYYTAVTFSDGTLKSTVPSAGLVSNNFMAKYGARQPYYIVAGPNYGVLSGSGLVGPDYNYSRADLNVLEPMGVNAIIMVPSKGIFINSNQTAKQVPVSALSKVHIRELVTYLQDELENMLQGYQWELNTQPLRDTVKAKADTILENIKNNGGIYAYNSVCDETNNTPETIDNEFLILDVEIEPARGSGKMVQTLTLHRTGALSSNQ